MRRLIGVLAIAMMAATGANAQDADVANTLKSLNFQTGHIALPSGIASIDVPPGYAFLDPHDSEVFLTKVWQNPPGAGQGVEGMLLPRDADWGVVIAYDNGGHVSDSDSQSINYDDLLADMKQDAVDHNDERQKNGYPPVVLLGWAEPPHYDAAAKTMYWAKRLRFGNDPEETLNYFIRVLGRSGVMELDVVAGSDQLADVQAHSDELLKTVSFNPGSAYADFRAGTDSVAAYGLAGLVAGGVLVKAGLFKGLLVLLAAFWKVIVVAVVAFAAAIGSFFRRLFTRVSSPPAGG